MGSAHTIGWRTHATPAPTESENRQEQDPDDQRRVASRGQFAYRVAMRARGATALALLVCVAGVASDVAAQDDVVPDAAPRPLAVAISGGASLGAWEAGYVYYLVETLLAAESPAFELRAIAGTSAGSINALLASIAYCGEPEPDPEASVFYRTWIPIGTQTLFTSESATPTSVFDRGAFDEAIEHLRGRFDAGGRPDCSVLLGMTATRVHPRIEAAARGRVQLSRMAERFLVRLEGRGALAPLAALVISENYFCRSATTTFAGRPAVRTARRSAWA